MSTALNLYLEIITDYGLEDNLKDYKYLPKIKKAIRVYGDDAVCRAITDCEKYLEEYWCERNKEIYKTDLHKVRHFTQMISGTLYNRKYRKLKIFGLTQ
mgnify:CR=1|tara:strand:+ start:916 stop:1212 length:297 start_codon:yes stop_codon:yes gene_type:complete